MFDLKRAARLTGVLPEPSSCGGAMAGGEQRVQREGVGKGFHYHWMREGEASLMARSGVACVLCFSL